MTIVQKDMRNNWFAEDNIELGNSRVLRIGTNKTSDGTIVTRASVHIRDGAFLSHRMFTDFSQRLMTAKVRCTEKNVATQHADAMTKIDELKEAVGSWYVAKGECLPA